MFARQVDPLAAFASTISAAESHHRPDQDSLHIHQNLPFASSPSQSSYSNTYHRPDRNNSDRNSNSNQASNQNSGCNPYKRKHPLQFEPEFFAALDASLQDFHEEAAQHSNTNGCWKSSLSSLKGSPPWPARPYKRAKNHSRNTASQSTGSTLKEPASLGSPPPTPHPQPPSPRSPHNSTPTTIPLSANRNSKKTPDPPSRRNTPPSFPQASPPSSAWSHRNVSWKSPAPIRSSKGPSIIDLSSGEELVAIRLGDQEQHKRRWSSSSEPSSPPESSDSLHQVFELQADGTLLPILDPSPADPSPSKRMRLSKANWCPYLHFLSDDESEIERLSTKMKADLRRRRAHNGFIGSNRTHRNTGLGRVVRSGVAVAGSTHAQEEPHFVVNGFWADHGMDATVGDGSQDKKALSDQSCRPQHGEPGTKRDHPSLDSNSPGSQALVLYKSLKSISLAPNQGTFDWNHWEDNETSRLIGLHGPHGHEMVLYQWEPVVRDPSSQCNQGCSVIREGSNNEEDDNLASTVLIEELKDENENDGNMADDEECELSDDAPLMDLEEQITDMDLD